MTVARYLAYAICACAMSSALAASVPPGDPFYVRYGQSVELAPGLKLKVVDVREGRCPALLPREVTGPVSVRLLRTAPQR
jgi:hypothetical protein